jgi:hypothetical protein
MAAAMETTATPMEAAAVVFAIAAATVAISMTIAKVPTVAIAPTVAVTATVAVTTTIAIAAAIAIIATAIIGMSVPGAGPDKDATVKPRRAIVAVRCAGVGSISVVPIGASRRAIGVTVVSIRTYADADRDLGLRVRYWDKEDRKQSNIS